MLEGEGSGANVTLEGVLTSLEGAVTLYIITFILSVLWGQVFFFHFIIVR